jgi:hypothetical protein
MIAPMTQHERPTRLSPEPGSLLPGGHFRWIVAVAILGIVAVSAAYAVGIG